ncbi:unnamed protein product [Brugia timori]|uniref:Uncharacterized protein n=1 Tax=Brugia timori TaxID=42155 RepID=A0A0R3QDV7_9BILA|nr:unnamed protein product [Brugia timori]
MRNSTCTVTTGAKLSDIQAKLNQMVEPFILVILGCADFLTVGTLSRQSEERRRVNDETVLWLFRYK